MIVYLCIGESLEYIAVCSGLTVAEIIDYNGFEPVCGNAFVLPKTRASYIITGNDNPIAVSKKIGITTQQLLDRCGGVFCAGKKIYY